MWSVCMCLVFVLASAEPAGKSPRPREVKQSLSFSMMMGTSKQDFTLSIFEGASLPENVIYFAKEYNIPATMWDQIYAYLRKELPEGLSAGSPPSLDLRVPFFPVRMHQATVRRPAVAVFDDNDDTEVIWRTTVNVVSGATVSKEEFRMHRGARLVPSVQQFCRFHKIMDAALVRQIIRHVMVYAPLDESLEVKLALPIRLKVDREADAEDADEGRQEMEHKEAYIVLQEGRSTREAVQDFFFLYNKDEGKDKDYFDDLVELVDRAVLILDQETTAAADNLDSKEAEDGAEADNQLDFFRVDPFEKRAFVFQVPEPDDRYYQHKQMLAAKGIENKFGDLDSLAVGISSTGKSGTVDESMQYDGVFPGTMQLPRYRPIPLDAGDLL